MFRREDIRYHTLWVRIVCCLAVATGVANAAALGALGPFEHFLRDVLTHGEAGLFAPLPVAAEVGVVFGMCLLAAIPRIERPIAMVVFGAVLVTAYVFGVVGVFLRSETMLPVASPLLGALGATGVLETMAWSEERARRRSLEGLERARQQFTDMLVHDLKKRMAAVLTALSVLERKWRPEAPEAEELLCTMRTSARRMLMLTSNLLDIRKMEEGRMSLRPETVSLPGLVEGTINEHHAAAELVGVTVRVAGPDGATARVDRQLVSRVLTNLLWNALQHAPAGSDVDVGWGPAGAAVVELYVANRGRPIPLSDQARMFQAFVSGDGGLASDRADSTGLGLAFCRLAVDAHGGSIALESPWARHGDGVKVAVRLPSRA